MMRVIEYRIFDRLTNEMIEVTKLEWGKHSLIGFEGQTGDSGGWYNVHKGHLNEKGRFNGSETRQKRYVLMQYTGLKDKNGTEIYEGDIVKFNDFWSGITGGNVGDTIRTCFVEYIMSGFFLRDVPDEEYEEDLGMALINDDELEVIGNIYEHPHLLGD